MSGRGQIGHSSIAGRETPRELARLACEALAALGEDWALLPDVAPRLRRVPGRDAVLVLDAPHGSPLAMVRRRAGVWLVVSVAANGGAR